MRNIKIINKLLILVFICLISLPNIDYFAKFSPIKDLFEKRQLKTAPDLPKNYHELWKFPKNFEEFFDDNYGFRKTLIFLNSLILDKIFDQPSDSRVVFGKNGWLYFDNYQSLLDISGDLGIDDDLVEKGVVAFYENWQYLKSKNITYLLVITPDKAVIYPEFLADYIKVGNKQRIDKFIKLLKSKYPDFPIIDLRLTIISAKEKEIIYHQTDTHWNRRGAHYAYIEIMKYLNKISDFNFKINYRSEFEDITNSGFRGDIADIINSNLTNIDYDLKPKFQIKSQRFAPTEDELKKFHKPIFYKNKSLKMPIAFIYKDSFFGNLQDFMSEHFSEMYLINEFPCRIDQKIIDKYQPQIFIQQFWQSRIQQILDRCS